MTKVRGTRRAISVAWSWRRTAALGMGFAFAGMAVAQGTSAAATAGIGSTSTDSVPSSLAEKAAPRTAIAGTDQPDPSETKRSQSYYHFALGHLYERSAEQYGRPDLATQAIEQYKLAIANDPDSVFLQNKLAETYFKLGRVKEAIETTERILKKHPDNLAAHKLLGRIYLRSLGDSSDEQDSGPMLDMAIREFKKVVDLEPNKVEDHLILGQMFLMKHDTTAAKAQFEAAQKIDPNSEDVVLNLARMYGEQGNYQEALTVLSNVPENDRSPRINLALGTIYDHMKKPKLAIQAYQNALTADPDNLDAQRALAEDLLSDDQIEPALKLLEGITTQDPEDTHSFLRLSEVERMRGNLAKANAALQHAKKLDPDSVEIRYNEAMIYQAQGRLGDAATILQQLAQSTEKPDGKYSEYEKNNRVIFLDRLASVYRNQNKTAEAVDTYNKMIALGGREAERGYQGEVDAYREAKMYPQALATARQAAQALPKSVNTQLALASLLADTGDPKAGIALAKAQLQNSKQDRVAWLTLAQIYTRVHKWKDASNAIDEAEKRNTSPQDMGLIYFLRGALEERQKHIDAAEENFRQSLKLNPDNALTLNYLGYMLADHGLKLNEALKLIEHAVRLDPTNGAYLDSLGWVHYKLGQYTLAEQVLEKAIALIPTDPTVRDHLGEVYATTGNLQQAVAEWQNSLKNYADSPAADAPSSEVNKVRKRLDKAKQKLAKEEARATAVHHP